jgi:hypothetical protein
MGKIGERKWNGCECHNFIHMQRRKLNNPSILQPPTI